VPISYDGGVTADSTGLKLVFGENAKGSNKDTYSGIPLMLGTSHKIQDSEGWSVGERPVIPIDSTYFTANASGLTLKNDAIKQVT
jgi:hypothetical protein